MMNIPAREFLNKYVSAYGETWEDTFNAFTDEPPCAKHMAEFIDDIERRGQQTPIFVDRSGMVSEGHKVALALYILDRNVNYMTSVSPDPSDNQIWIVEFDLDSPVEPEWYTHIYDYLSFRLEGDWVYPLDADVLDDGSMIVAIYCESGEYTADRLPPYISQRIREKGGITISGVNITAGEAVDGDAH